MASLCILMCTESLDKTPHIWKISLHYDQLRSYIKKIYWYLLFDELEEGKTRWVTTINNPSVLATVCSERVIMETMIPDNGVQKLLFHAMGVLIHQESGINIISGGVWGWVNCATTYLGLQRQRTAWSFRKGIESYARYPVEHARNLDS
jgi:hypothetical protein